MCLKLNIYGIIFLVFAQFTFGQGAVGIDGSTAQLLNAAATMSNSKGSLVSAYVKNPPRKIFGSYYVFENWKNKGIIYVSENQIFKINNININVKDSSFEAKVNKDSLFTFNQGVIDYFLINNRKFKYTYIDQYKENKISELIVEDQDFTILKAYNVDVKVNDPDPLMLKPDGDEYILRFQYFIKRGEVIQKFKLSKKYILNVFSKNKQAIENFVKENRLSYKNEQDLKKIYTKWKSL